MQIIDHEVTGSQASLNDILEKTSAHRTGSGWLGHCPAHDDNNASLSIAEGDDERILLYCHAGCDLQDVLQALGLDMKDLFPNSEYDTEPEYYKGKRVIRKYNYRDVDGKLLYQALRLDPKDFVQRRPAGDGKWEYTTSGVKKVLYRLTELAKIPDFFRKLGWNPVYIVEGEKDVDALRDRGFLATCNVGGAGKGKWLPEYSESLRGFHVIIIPDNDAPGYEHADRVALSLQGIASSIKVLELSGLPEKGDVSDWLKQGHTISELKELSKKAPIYSPKNTSQMHKEERTKPTITSARTLMETEIEPTRSVVGGLLVEGVTLLAARQKVGKSWLVLDFALAVSRGKKALGKLTTEKGDVLYISLEDNRAAMQERLEALLGREEAPENLYIAHEWPLLCCGGLEELESFLEGHPNTKLVAIDVLQRVRTPIKSNANLYQEDYNTITSVKKVADKYHVAILLVHHFRKADGADPYDAITGSMGLSGAADASILLKRERVNMEASLMITGRKVQEQELALSFSTDCKWSLVGEAAEVRRTEFEKEALDILGREENKNGFTPSEYAKATNRNRNVVKVQLSRMFTKGLLKCNDGKYYVTTVTSDTEVSRVTTLPSRQTKQMEAPNERVVTGGNETSKHLLPPYKGHTSQLRENGNVVTHTAVLTLPCPAEGNGELDPFLPDFPDE